MMIGEIEEGGGTPEGWLSLRKSAQSAVSFFAPFACCAVKKDWIPAPGQKCRYFLQRYVVHPIDAPTALGCNCRVTSAK